MEITKEQIIEAFEKDSTLIEGVLPKVIESEVGKNLIENKAKVIFDEKIGDEVKKIHTLYDNDIFETLGVRAGTKEDGSKEKTYEVAKKLYSELKELRGQKDSLTKDAKVNELLGQIETLKKEGGGKHFEEILNQSKLTWDEKEKNYLKQIDDSKHANETFLKQTAIQSALNQIKFNPDTPESIKKMVISSVEKDLVKNSKLEEGKLVFLDAEGKPMIDTTSYQPKNALQVLASMEAIKDISLKEDKEKGGGAQSEIHGSIQTTKVEGKDVQKLILPEGSIKTKTQFQEIANKALSDSGITIRDPRWTKLKDEAYLELKVKDMPSK